MSHNLLIVESPSKAKTIKKYLGPDWKISASMGHIRDLPQSHLGVDVSRDFEPMYINVSGKNELIKSLKQDAKNADRIFLATDPDREGGGHLMASGQAARHSAGRGHPRHLQ